MSKKNNAKNIVILGAGISGLTVSYFLNKFKIKNLFIIHFKDLKQHII